MHSVRRCRCVPGGPSARRRRAGAGGASPRPRPRAARRGGCIAWGAMRRTPTPPPQPRPPPAPQLTPHRLTHAPAARGGGHCGRARLAHARPRPRGAQQQAAAGATRPGPGRHAPSRASSSARAGGRPQARRRRFVRRGQPDTEGGGPGPPGLQSGHDSVRGRAGAAHHQGHPEQADPREVRAPAGPAAAGGWRARARALPRRRAGRQAGGSPSSAHGQRGAGHAGLRSTLPGGWRGWGARVPCPC
jgi:hypothetical protein